jgi:UDP-glucose 4-epimerase
LDNLATRCKEYLDEFNVSFYEGDIRDQKLVKDLTKDVDSIVHLAADTRVLDSMANPDLNFSVWGYPLDSTSHNM